MQKLFIIILLNLLFYFKTIYFGYVNDDEEVSHDIPKGFFKKLKAILFNSNLWNPPLEHLVSLLTHTLVCSLIYLVFGMSDVSFWAAMFFSVNPANLMGAVNLSSRHYALNTILMLLGAGSVVLFPVFYLLSVLLGFSTAPMPLVYLNTPFWGMIFIIPLWCLLKYNYHGEGFFKQKFDKTTSSATMKKISPEKIIIAFKTLCYYTCFCLFPKKCGMYHDFLYTYGVRKEDNAQWLTFDKWFWGGIIILWVILSNLHIPGLLWYLVAISMWCNLLPMVQQPFAERYAYLANVGLMLALSSVVFSINNIAIRSFILGGIFIGYLVRCYIELNSFKDNNLFLQYNVADFNFPHQYFAWTIKGEYELFKLNDWAKGLDSFRNAYLSRKVCSRINFRLAYLLGILGKYEEALFHFDIAMKNPMEGFEETRDDVVLTTMRKQLEDGLARIKNANSA